jgi:hypothetical protein
MVTAMRRTAVILGLIFLAALFQGSGAVAQDSGPTDADLKAAYCLNAIRERESSLTPQCLTASPPPSYAKICHDDQTNIERLKDYLVARGYLFGEKDATWALLAGNRGSADEKDCDSRHISPEEEACTKKCLPQVQRDDVRDFMTCWEACPIPDSCRRLRPCDDLSFLPF